MSDSENPTRAGDAPLAVNLEAGQEYYWCACGRSSGQPYCDGSHKETSFTPMSFTPSESGEAHLCMCKQTKNPPYCDGSHAG
ncbi:MAG: CDGSH iron-sulfur domain-containing protein [Gammaproteobacteria bacterium]